MIYAPNRICPWKWDTLYSQKFWDTNGSSNPCQKEKPIANYQRKIIKEIVI